MLPRPWSGLTMLGSLAKCQRFDSWYLCYSDSHLMVKPSAPSSGSQTMSIRPRSKCISDLLEHGQPLSQQLSHTKPCHLMSFVIICHVIPGSFEKVAGRLHSSASRTSWTTVQGELGRTPREDLGWPLAWNQWNQIPSLLRCRLTAFTCGSLKQELCRHGNFWPDLSTMTYNGIYIFKYRTILWIPVDIHVCVCVFVSMHVCARVWDLWQVSLITLYARGFPDRNSGALVLTLPKPLVNLHAGATSRGRRSADARAGLELEDSTFCPMARGFSPVQNTSSTTLWTPTANSLSHGERRNHRHCPAVVRVMIGRSIRHHNAIAEA